MKIIFLAAALTGLWVSPAGEVIEVPCPEPIEFHAERVRMPRGCMADQMGVWLSVERYKELEIAEAVAQVEVEEQRATIKELEQKVKDLQRQNLRQSLSETQKDCYEPQTPFFVGALTATVIATGGCALWNLSN